jgi:hypothetical protein
VSIYLKRAESHYVKSRKEAVYRSPWAKFVAKTLTPNGDRRYTCFEFIGDYQTYIDMSDEISLYL